MNDDKYFPQGIATDVAFCNRIGERKSLKNSIEAHENVVLAAPRRYGKTSLIAQVLKENDFASISIDLFFIMSQEDVKKQISDGIAKVISSLLPKTQKACNNLLDYIRGLNPKITLELLGQKLEINSKQPDEKSITELLLLLDQFMTKINKTCVIAFDEFQQVGELKENHVIEAAIRHAVERSKRVSYLFCGSKQHLLNDMFTQKSRPLYHLCDLMNIDRIGTESYIDFLNKAAKRKWGAALDNDVVNEILILTENHPYYVNVLCRHLWRHENTPTLKQTRDAWIGYINQQTTWLMTEFNNLSLNRKKVLTALAYSPINEPQGHSFSQQTTLSASNIKTSLRDLIKLDLVYKDHQGFYRVVDPALAYFIRMQS